ncbi:transporter substrate-binding domain-containing protein [Lysobacter sp. S4-A87]|uniref:transporter substrate-binding domain-containing protein n=1 Tax=Lysobacter sp. S4-A87 TaxID=2925843 RepID=UPI001F52FCA9|nr:transporter substrate-binding domain-containing protein [Lysobacter sp. S4-A87]UNK48148.1 transporter substrate-binding domain-containing protein [Lysobacter sp. S4-A87]
MPTRLARPLLLAAMLFAVFASLLIVTRTASAEEGGVATLDAEEAQWRREHPVVRVGVFAGDHLPAETWVAGHPEGLGPDYARLLAAKVGLRLSFDPFTDWEAISWPAASQPPRYDLLLAQPDTPARRSHLSFLRPYLKGYVMLVARRGDTRIRGEADLARARIVVERRYLETAGLVVKRFPQSIVLYAQDGREALRMVADGEADAYVGNTEYRTRTLLHQRSVDDLVLLGAMDLPALRLSLAVPTRETMLLRLLRKAEATVKPEELKSLQARWGVDMLPSTTEPAAVLTGRERRVLEGLPVLRLGYETNRPLYSFVNVDGEFDGMAANYVKAVQKGLGLRLELVPAKDWTDLQRMVHAGEIDMVAAAMADDFRGDDLVFSRPYERFPEVLVARVHGPTVAGPEDLRGRRVAARGEAGLMARLKIVLDQSTLVPVGSNEEGLAMVADGQADAFVGTFPAIDALIRDRYAARLQMVGPTGLDHELSFGVRRSHADMLPLVNNALAGISDQEKQAIRTRWLSNEYSFGVPWGWVFGIILAGCIIVGLMSVAHLSMRRQVRARTAAERKLADQLQFQERLLNNIHYPVFVKDTQGRYLAVNLAYTLRYGVEESDLVGRTLLETRHLPQIEIEAIHDFEMSVFTTGKQLSKELRTEAPDGSERHELLWVQMFELGNGEPAGLLGTAVDITEIRVAEARARASELRLAQIARTLPSAVFELRVWPDGRREFTYADGDTLSTIGITPDEMMADEALAFSHVYVDDRQLVADNVAAAAAAMQPMPQFDVRLHSVQGLRWVRTAGGPPRHGPDGSVDWSGYWIDVTDSHEQAQALARANAEAEAAVAAKAAFLAMMSHEIRTPMAGVLGLVELLAQTRTDREQAQMLAMAQDSARTLLQLLDDILDFSRIDSGRLELENAPFDLRSLCDGVIGLFTAKAHEKGLRLYCMIDWRLAAEFAGDAVRVRQIITNLLSNAVKFTHRGHVELRIELLEECVEEGANLQKLSVTVTDTGIGISGEQFLRLFRPFTQAESSTTRRFGGSGLGLIICQRLANLMGGTVQLKSTPDVGTRAVLELKLPVVAKLRPLPEFAGKPAVLCAQDPMFALELSNALSSMGFSVVEIEVSDLPTLDCDRAELFLIDRRLAESGQRPPRGRCLLLEEVASNRLPAVAGRAADRIVHGNPLLWRSLRDACRAVFERASPDEPTLGSPRLSLQAARILVAEDHPVNRAVIARQLAHLGFECVVAVDGEQALAALVGGGFDLLITDCDMPKMDGYALARRIRADEAGQARRLPIIALSASALPADVQRCNDAGMDGFLAKPMTLQELETMLARHLSADPEPVPAMAEPLPVDPMTFLTDSLGSAEEARRLLHELLSTCREDMRAFDLALASGDTRTQHKLLHRMRGALALLRDAPPANTDHDMVIPLVRQRDELLLRLDRLDRLLHDPDVVPVAANEARHQA